MWNGTGNQIKLILVRHGQTCGNLRHAYIGVTDEPLCPLGVETVTKKKAVLEAVYKRESLWKNRIFASSMKRCIETARILFPGDEITEVMELRETNFGTFEGKNYEELNGDLIYQRWIDSNGTMAFSEGESMEQVRERTLEGLKNLLLDTKRDSELIDAITLVIHGGTIMTILSNLAGGDYYDYQVKNGEGYLCTLTVNEEDTFRITGLQKIE